MEQGKHRARQFWRDQFEYSGTFLGGGIILQFSSRFSLRMFRVLVGELLLDVDDPSAALPFFADNATGQEALRRGVADGLGLEQDGGAPYLELIPHMSLDCLAQFSIQEPHSLLPPKLSLGTGSDKYCLTSQPLAKETWFKQVSFREAQDRRFQKTLVSAGLSPWFQGLNRPGREDMVNLTAFEVWGSSAGRRLAGILAVGYEISVPSTSASWP